MPVGHPPGSPDQGAGPLLRGEFDLTGRVVVDRALPDRAVERGAQRGSDVRQCRRGVRLAEPVRFSRDCGEERGQPSRGQLCQPARAEVGDEEPFKRGRGF